MTPPFRRASRLEGLDPYRPRLPGSAPTYKVDANEASASPDNLRAYVDALTPELLNRYTRPAALEADLAERYAVTPEQVAVTAGADDGLFRLCQLTLEAGRQAVLSRPTFEMLPRYVALSGGSPAWVDWLGQPVPTDALVEAVGPATGVVFLVTPSSPAGEVAGRDTVERLAAACARVGALLVVDHAYVEFADDDLTAAALSLPNTVVARTFSKAWGLAGLRVGYLLGPPSVIEWLKTVGQPYAVATPSVAVARSVLAGGVERMRARVARVKAERARLYAALAELDAAPIASHGNFVLARLGPRGRPFAEAMAARGVAVRCFAAPQALAGGVRLTCPGDDEAFAAMLSAIPDALAVAREGQP